jgi:transposase-like protein
MAETKVKCLYCGTDKASKMGSTNQGKPRYVCRNPMYGHSFILECSNYGCHPGIREQISDMAVNGSSILRLSKSRDL